MHTLTAAACVLCLSTSLLETPRAAVPATPGGGGTTTILAWKQSPGWFFNGTSWRYAAGYDLDNDGYAMADAPSSARIELTVPSSNRLAPPAGFVTKAGDDDDTDPNVHPRRPEVLGNGIDDDCDGEIDETEFHRLASGDRTTDGFTMRTRINDPAILAILATYTTYSPFVWRLDRLSYQIEYQNLKDTSSTASTAIEPVTGMTVYPSVAEFPVTLSGLRPRNVYRARVVFFSTRTLFLGYQFHTQIHTRVGEPSEWYYQCTEATNDMANARAHIVSRGLYHEFCSEQLGLLGYNGSTYPNGTRFAADLGELWCTEFYAECANERFTMGHRSHIGVFDPVPSSRSSSAMSHYFDAFGEMTVVTPSTHAAVLPSMKPGDYLALDTSNDGNPNHSAMFLAWDESTGKVWTVEGNVGNKCRIIQRNPDQIAGWGCLRASMR